MDSARREKEKKRNLIPISRENKSFFSRLHEKRPSSVGTVCLSGGARKCQTRPFSLSLSLSFLALSRRYLDTWDTYGNV